MTKLRVLLAGLFHETHTFVDEITGIADYNINRGAAITARRGDGSTIDGFLEIAEREGWDVVPIIDYSALPSGTTEQAVFERFWDELRAGTEAALANGGLDGIWLGLHGAMVTTDCEDPECNNRTCVSGTVCTNGLCPGPG